MNQILINEEEAKIVKNLMDAVDRDEKISHPIKFENHFKNLLLKVNKFLKSDDIL